MSKYQEYIQKIKDAPGGKETGTQAAMVEFARFLAKLSEDAEIKTDENIRLQKRVVNLTWGLFGLTIVLLIVALPPAIAVFRQKPQSP